MMRRPSSSANLLAEKNHRHFPVIAGIACLCTLFFYVGAFFCRTKAPVETETNTIFDNAPLPKPFKPCRLIYQDITPCMDPNRWDVFDHRNFIFRERHCPPKSERKRCLVPPVTGYKIPIRWPESLGQSWYDNVPFDWITKEKSNQHWMDREDDKWIFTGGGTMFPTGVDKYLDALEAVLPPLKDGTIRTALDTGCGVASWGGYLFKRDVLALSLAPRDNHEAQVQFALERGIPAMLGVIGSQRLPYPSRAFDMVHCGRCLIPWTLDGGVFLLEVARIIRPGGFWVLSGPPMNWKKRWEGWNTTVEKQQGDMDGLRELMKNMCFSEYNIEGEFGIWQKSSDNECLRRRPAGTQPPLCEEDDESVADAAWYVPMKTCVTPLPEGSFVNRKLPPWPARVDAMPPRAHKLRNEIGTSFESDTKLWVHRVRQYKKLVPQLGTTKFRNVMDMSAGFGGFAAALIEHPVWVMNVVSPFSVDTLGAVFERGLIGTYNDWCESFSTYPRTYDLLHVTGWFGAEGHRCENEDVLLEMDRILRPNGVVILRDFDYVVEKLAKITALMRWACETHQPEDVKKTEEHEPADLIMVCTKEFWTL